jgi:hypothetical protein
MTITDCKSNAPFPLLLPKFSVIGIWLEQRAQHIEWMVQNTHLFELFSCPIAQFSGKNYFPLFCLFSLYQDISFFISPPCYL